MDWFAANGWLVFTGSPAELIDYFGGRLDLLTETSAHVSYPCSPDCDQSAACRLHRTYYRKA